MLSATTDNCKNKFPTFYSAPTTKFCSIGICRIALALLDAAFTGSESGGIAKSKEQRFTRA